jgi:hypothetical protein
MGKQLLVPLLAGHSIYRNKLMVHNEQTSPDDDDDDDNVVIIIIIIIIIIM